MDNERLEKIEQKYIYNTNVANGFVDYLKELYQDDEKVSNILINKRFDGVFCNVPLKKYFLKSIIKGISFVFDGDLSEKEIIEKLLLNNFRGIYIISDKDFIDCKDELSEKDKKIIGCYANANKTIYIPESMLSDYNVLIHEFIHALINNHLSVEVRESDVRIPIDKADLSQCDDRVIRIPNEEEMPDAVLDNYGYGIEEGICSAVSSSFISDNKAFECNATDGYKYQVKIVEQLNMIYSYYSKKKYSSFILHAIKEPRSVLKLIKDMYLDLLLNKFGDDIKSGVLDRKEIENLAYYTAYDIVATCDYLCEHNDDLGFYAASYINADYLCLANNNICRSMYNPSEINIFGDKILSFKKGKAEGMLLDLLFGPTNCTYDHEILDRLLKTQGYITDLEETGEVRFLKRTI